MEQKFLTMAQESIRKQKKSGIDRWYGGSIEMDHNILPNYIVAL